ncbi:MAG: nucleotidyltransferase domain-containing protein, partial [Clostridia bacterium]|nr:nucleotidyltransferase domain-containing protein [Deltaproteobacteria bacterium]
MDDAILERDARDPLNGFSAPAFELELKRLLLGRVDAAYVFGSFGTPSFGAQSDIDLILITRTSESFT